MASERQDEPDPVLRLLDGRGAHGALLDRFKPTVVFDSAERHFPCSAEFFCLHSTLEVCDSVDQATGKKIPGKSRVWRELAGPAGSLTAAELPMIRHDGQSCCEQGRYMFRLRPERSSWTGQGMNLESVPFYCFAQQLHPELLAEGVADADEGDVVVDLTYAFLYTYNGSTALGTLTALGIHEGDLEHVVVRVLLRREPDSQGRCERVLEVFYAAHKDEGQWLRPAEAQFEGESLLVFAARYGHASRPKAGVVRRMMGLGNDECDGAGARWRPGHLVELTRDVDNPRVPEEPAWARFHGQWGEDGPWSIRHNWWWKNLCEEERRVNTARRSRVERAAVALDAAAPPARSSFFAAFRR